MFPKFIQVGYIRAVMYTEGRGGGEGGRGTYSRGLLIGLQIRGRIFRGPQGGRFNRILSLCPFQKKSIVSGFFK